MNAFTEFTSRGGPVMLPLLVLSVLLYERCFSLLLFLFRVRREVGHVICRDQTLARIHRLERNVQAAFRQQRIAIEAMITAAPLLGLLGTVMGMIRAFTNISGRGNGHTMEGLAQGISEVLVATESGLAVAIPAVVLMGYAHRQLQKRLKQLAGAESLANRG